MLQHIGLGLSTLRTTIQDGLLDRYAGHLYSEQRLNIDLCGENMSGL